MRLLRFWADRLPGIRDGFDFIAEPGLNLVTGPNGVGKSSVARALHFLLWPSGSPGSPDLAVHARFACGGRTLQAECRGGSGVVWMENGTVVPPPELPPAQLAACHHLDILDLLPALSHADDERLAGDLLKEMSGGVDVIGVRDRVFPAKGQSSQRKHDDLLKADQEIRDLKTAQDALRQEELSLAELEAVLQRARLADRRRAVLQAARDRLRASARLDAAQQELDGIPSGVANVREDDPAVLGRIRSDLGKKRGALDRIRQEIGNRQDTLAQLGVTQDPGPSLAPLEDRLKELRTRSGELLHARREYEEARKALDQALGRAQGDGAEDPAVADALDPAAFTEVVKLSGRLQEHRAKARSYAAQLEAPVAPGRRPWARYLVWAGSGAAAAAVVLAVTPPGWPAALPLAAVGLGALTAALILRGLSSPPPLPGDAAVFLRREEDACAEISGQLTNLARRLGLNVDLQDPAIPLLLQSALALREKRIALEGRQNSCEVLIGQCAGLLERINAGLADLGAGKAGDADDAERTVAGIRKQWERSQELTRSLEDLTRQGQELQDEISRLEQDIAGLFTRLGLDPQRDPDTLVDRHLEHKARFTELTREIESCRGDLRRLDEALTAGRDLFPGEDIAGNPAPVLEDRCLQEEQQAVGLTGLAEKIGGIKKSIEQAREGHGLQDALARRGRTRDELQVILERQSINHFGRLMLDRARQEHQQRTRPGVLRAADEYLARFTGNRYRLVHQAREDGGAAFLAEDTETGRTLTPAQLSAGTRAQLFLAVRLGFLGKAAGGVKPPLVLDDTLGSFDPGRFAAVVVSLGRLVEQEDRQVFYLCPRPADARAWREILASAGLPGVHEIDLAACRQLATAAPPEALRPWNTTAPVVPDPHGKDPQQYALEIGVPALDPQAGPEAVHLFYLLSDHLDWLRTLLVAGCATLGRWQAGRRTVLASGDLTDRQAAELEARARIWRSFLKHWRIGRPGPVPRSFLVESSAITGTFLDRVADCLGQAGGDGRVLLDALRDRQVKGFLTRNIDQLEAELEEGSYLDPRPPLDRDELIQSTLAAVAEEVREGVLDTETIHLLVDRFESALEIGR